MQLLKKLKKQQLFVSKLAILSITLIILTGFKNIDETMNNDNYLKEIPFEFSNGLPIIKVSINHQYYNFLFDTGMPTAISKTLSDDMKLSFIRNSQGSDVNGNASNENYVTINSLSVSGLDFHKTEALVANLNSSFELGCLNLSGVFGNNLIKNAIWEIDYKNQIIRFTNDLKNLNITNDVTKLKFKTNKSYFSPLVSIKINNKRTKNIKFDTGSNQGINLPLAAYSKYINDKNSIEFYGKNSVALYGRGVNKKSVLAKIPIAELGPLKLDNQIINFNHNTSLIGNSFLSNYKVIINYNEHLIYLIKQKESEHETIRSFGFKASVIESKIIILGTYKKSVAEREGLRIGDEILNINGLTVSEILDNKPCNYLKNALVNNDSIRLKISRNGIKKDLNLTKEKIL